MLLRFLIRKRRKEIVYNNCPNTPKGGGHLSVHKPRRLPAFMERREWCDPWTIARFCLWTFVVAVFMHRRTAGIAAPRPVDDNPVDLHTELVHDRKLEFPTHEVWIPWYFIPWYSVMRVTIGAASTDV
jgi:hypothetical protein